MFGGHDEYEQKFEEAPKRKISEILRALAGRKTSEDQLVLIRRVLLITLAEELESMGK